LGKGSEALYISSGRQVGGRRLNWTKERTVVLSNREWLSKKGSGTGVLESRCSGNEGWKRFSDKTRCDTRGALFSTAEEIH
jgi:hypothetical protein